jgi:hypothetical protein
MSLHREYSELGIRKPRGATSLNRQHGDEDHSDITEDRVVREKRERRPYVAYLLSNGEGVVEELVGRIKTGPDIKKAAIRRSEKAAIRLIEEWQDADVGSSN